jgi:DNA-binding NarL/FixJ family response regulator
MLQIALVEDDEEIRSVYAYLINKDSEMKAHPFGDSESFLAACKSNKFDVAIMDVNLPGMDGITCTRNLKDISPETLVLMFTVYENNENIFKALEAGANGYLVKQSSPISIIEAIRELHSGGAPMSGQIARKVLEHFFNVKKPNSNQYGLSEREQQILNLLATGYRYQDIADQLYISFGTVRTHIYNIYTKMHVDNRTEALNKWRDGK